MLNQSHEPELSEPERACLALAWEAFLAGTNPVGAVVIDATGRIVASGRNAVYGAHPTLLSASRPGLLELAARHEPWPDVAPVLLAAVGAASAPA